MPSWLQIAVLALVFLVAMGQAGDEETKPAIRTVLGIVGIAAFGAFLIRFTGMPEWLAAVLILAGVVAVIAGRGDSDVVLQTLLLGLAIWVGILLVPALFRATFEQDWLSADEYRSIGSKDLDTFDEVESRFGGEAQDLAQDLGSGGGKCHYYWTERWGPLDSNEQAYQVCFKRDTGTLASKREVDLETITRPGPPVPVP